MRILLTGAAAVLLFGCSHGLAGAATSLIPGRLVLDQMNTEPPPPGAFPSLYMDVRDLVESNLPDAYWHPAQVVAKLSDPAAAGSLADAVQCADRNRRAGDDTEPCLEALLAALQFAAAPAGGVPADPQADARWQDEMDTVRVGTNLREVVLSTGLLYQTHQLESVSAASPATREEIRTGFADGLAKFARYQSNRKVVREAGKRVNAWVLSGGSANGAFSAGAAWWLLRQLDQCQQAAAEAKTPAELARYQGCLTDRLDLVGGASTGALVGILAKDYFADEPGRRQRALEKMVAEYTCRVNSDLYCDADHSLDGLLFGESGGMVSFNGIYDSLQKTIDDKTLASRPEYIASTVDVQSGNAVHLSSANAADIDSAKTLQQAVMASIVQPGMAEPLTVIGGRKGVFIDGGIRSGLPLLSALMSGAEGAVVFVNAPLDPLPRAKPPPNALAITMRSIDLFVHQTILGELHGAEYRAESKRRKEAELCQARLSASPGQRTLDYCQGHHELLETGPQALTRAAPRFKAKAKMRSMTSEATGPFSSDARRAWLFMPHQIPGWLAAKGVSWTDLSATGYRFVPSQTWRMFMLGAAVAQLRCDDVNEVLGWHLTQGDPRGCASLEELQKALGPLEAGHAACEAKVDELKTCPSAEAPCP